MEKFKAVREWGQKRGIDGCSFQRQYQRTLQEVVEIHDAYNDNDSKEIADAIGDSIVTLINLAKTVNMKAEDCLGQAFDVIELRKGLNFNGDFVRYGKLSAEHQKICDEKQGNPGSEYYKRDADLSPEDFKY